MKFLLSALVIVLAITVITAKRHRNSTKWKSIKEKHKINFHSEEDEIQAFANFDNNDFEIDSHNNDSRFHFKTGHNEFSHWSKLELQKHKGLKPVKVVELSNKRGVILTSRFSGQNHTFQYYAATAGYVPKQSIDWVAAGWNTPVRNQLQCGDCWAFASTAAHEAAIWMKSKTNVVLSPQQLTDCSFSYGNNGCNGGVPGYAFGYMNDVGLAEETNYPFTGVQGSCYESSVPRPYKLASSYYFLQQGDDNVLMEALDKFGPLPVGISVNNAFQFYKSGIFAVSTGVCAQTINHAVLLTGYGVNSLGKKYWTIKNQWGTSWGNKGYMNVSRDRVNNCGISSQVFVPIL